MRKSSYSSEEKSAIVSGWLSSGISQRSYCSAHGYSYESFKTWLRLYRQEHQIREDVRTRKFSGRFVSLDLSGATELSSAAKVLEPSAVCSRIFSSVEITYPSGTHLKLGCEVGVDELRTLL